MKIQVFVFQSELKEASNYSMGSHHMSCTQGVIFHHFPPSCIIFMTILMIQDYDFTLSSNLDTPATPPNQNKFRQKWYQWLRLDKILIYKKFRGVLSAFS